MKETKVSSTPDFAQVRDIRFTPYHEIARTHLSFRLRGKDIEGSRKNKKQKRCELGSIPRPRIPKNLKV